MIVNEKTLDEIANEYLKENRICLFINLYNYLGDYIKNDEDRKNSLLYKTSEKIIELSNICSIKRRNYSYEELYEKLYNCGKFLTDNNRKYLDAILTHCYSKTISNSITLGRMKILLNVFSYYKNAIRNYSINKSFSERNSEDSLRELIIKDYMTFFVLGSFSTDIKRFNIIANEYMEIFFSSLFDKKEDIDKMDKETLFSICKFTEDNPKYEYDKNYITKFKAVYMEKLI